MAPTASLLVVCFNDLVVLERMLRCHVMCSGPELLEILVCDDGSSENVKGLLERLGKSSRIPLRHVFQEDRGWDAPGIRNKGAMQAQGDYLIFTDYDCIPHPRFAEDHLKAAEKGAFVFGDRAHVGKAWRQSFSSSRWSRFWHSVRGRIKKRSRVFRSPLEKPLRFRRGDISQFEEIGSLALTCTFGVWREDFLHVNGFDESFKFWWPEDIELSARLLNAGLMLKKFKRQCLVFHLDHDGSRRPTPESEARIRHSLENGVQRTSYGLMERMERDMRSASARCPPESPCLQK